MAVKKVVLISPRGFCAGVERAVDTVDKALEIFGKPLYVKHEIVHNKTVCDNFRARGVVFVDDIKDVPEGAVCIYSAHGIAPEVREDAKKRKLITIDATCPLVTKIHIEVENFAREGLNIIYIGHKGHPEAVGVLGVRPDITTIVENVEDVKSLEVKDPEKLVYLTQTTLSVDECSAVISALKERFPDIKKPPKDDICYATTNRQAAIKEAAKKCDVILVVGSKNSSNSNRLVETARESGADSYLVDSVADIDEKWFAGKETVGISAGASAPEHLVKEIAAHFSKDNANVEELKVIDENMKFTMPYELRNLKKNDA